MGRSEQPGSPGQIRRDIVQALVRRRMEVIPGHRDNREAEAILTKRIKNQRSGKKVP